VVLDHDVLKTALLDAGLPAGAGDPVTDPEDLGSGPGGAGAAAYAVAFSIAAGLLADGRDVVLDSPCYYLTVLRDGQAVARGAGACYLYVECVTEDLGELARRLAARPGRRSQCRDLAPASAAPAPVSGEELFRAWMAGMRRPGQGYLRLDTSRPVAETVASAVAFVDAEMGGSGR
jgi:hypothetical protein